MMGCAPKVSYGTNTFDAKCDAMRVALPSYSIRDTEQSKREGLVFLDVFDMQCGSNGK